MARDRATATSCRTPRPGRLPAAVSFCSALALVVSGWTLPAAAQSTSSHRVSPSGLLAAHFTSASITNAEKVLAQSGIATVAEESSTKPLVKVAGAVRITFTQPQVRAMALGAAEGSGVSGAALDAARAGGHRRHPAELSVGLLGLDREDPSRPGHP
jgi:hypothetical protein